MSKHVKSIFAMICVVVLLAGLPGGFSLAADEELIPDESASTEREITVLECTPIPLFVDEVYIGDGFMLDGTTYVPMLAFCEAMLRTDFEAFWDQELGYVSLQAENVDISMKLSDNYIVANGRYLYLADGAYNVNGTIMAPIRELAKIFNVEVIWDDYSFSIDIDTSNVEPIMSGDEFYDEESLYWLSRVISSEAGGEPMDGRIGVGNVVLNRVNDDSGAFEDTIKRVIFQIGQFAVTESGAIYLEPNEESVIAAKLCLEGYNTVGDSKYFLNPEISSSKWFQKYKTYVMTISDHDFYA